MLLLLAKVADDVLRLKHRNVKARNHIPYSAAVRPVPPTPYRRSI
jgi:hypothetical protein